ncbi:AAA family ATPase [Conexibacter sp. S30A1]|uniref:AAA family ATPase n=1 Tax=Conexibacter sp. S30A1 TaxID=2937800 RepID=UPI00200D9F3F|nr:ATP-binding protein [Conexibacter sp. S30A1]
MTATADKLSALFLDDASPLPLEDIARAATGIDDARSAVEAFFSPTPGLEERQARAALLIHALRRNPELFEGRGLKARREALGFVGDAFAQQFRSWKIAFAGEDFEKLQSLASLPDAALKQIENAAAQLVSLTSLESARGEIQRAFGTYRPLLVPLIPAPLAKSKLTDLFTAVAEVRATVGPAFLAAHARASETMSDFRRDVEAAGPVAMRCFSELLSRLDDVLTEVYEKNAATQPAEVEVTSAGKKYPLSSIDATLRLGLIVVNRGPGQALDVRIVELEGTGLRLETESVPLGILMPDERAAGTVAGVSVGEESCLVIGRVEWSNSDGSANSAPFEVMFESQRSDIDWDHLRQRYDLEPVRTKQELVGRAELLRELVDLVGERSVGNAFVTGQKRVGKTSIALTFQSQFSIDDDIAVVYLEAGAYIRPSAEGTIAAMGTAVASELTATGPRFSDIPIPDFEATLAPLRGIVGQMRQRVPKLRVIVILDEFDELPRALYRRGDIGDAFFVALRTLASQQHIGFVLVGGEKMGPIIDAQGDQLNKFESVPVTYLDRERHWDDFSDLIRQPVADCFEVTDEAIVAMYDHTAGHPYFTKLICRALFKLAVNRRDAHITAQEVVDATADALDGASVTNFIHFWEDGVLESAEKVEDISVRRRKVLLAYAEARECGDRTVDAVVERAATFGLADQATKETLREFERRGVLEVVDGCARTKVRFFDMWLERYGRNAITTTFTDPDAVLNAKLREMEQRVSSEEISDVIKHWGHYGGVR